MSNGLSTTLQHQMPCTASYLHEKQLRIFRRHDPASGVTFRRSLFRHFLAAQASCYRFLPECLASKEQAV